MRAVWASRQEELLYDCLVSPHIFAPMVDRLRDFAVPYQHLSLSRFLSRMMRL
jgi:hypothetical protein